MARTEITTINFVKGKITTCNGRSLRLMKGNSESKIRLNLKFDIDTYVAIVYSSNNTPISCDVNNWQIAQSNVINAGVPFIDTIYVSTSVSPTSSYEGSYMFVFQDNSMIVDKTDKESYIL